jgi:NADPH:quinone reductase-like Zn-dependent oxidoreductase
MGLSSDRLPMILGCDGAGVSAAGEPVVVHAVIGDPAAGGGDETLDPKRTLLSELHQGTLAEVVTVPEYNVVPKPASLSWEEAACLSTAWLTAFRMLFRNAGLPDGGGGAVLVQGAGGGVATAAVLLAKAAGHTVFATSRDEAKRKRVLDLGADEAFDTGARLPRRVDAVIETVGAATLDHSMRAVRPGGRVVVSGATSGYKPEVDLRRIFFLQVSLIGSAMGSRQDLRDLLAFLDRTGVRPLVDDVRPLADARTSFARLEAGEVFGKLVLTI